MLMPVAWRLLDSVRERFVMSRGNSRPKRLLFVLRWGMDWTCSAKGVNMVITTTRQSCCLHCATHLVEPRFHDLRRLFGQIAAFARFAVLVLVWAGHKVRRLPLFERGTGIQWQRPMVATIKNVGRVMCMWPISCRNDVRPIRLMTRTSRVMCVVRPSVVAAVYVKRRSSRVRQRGTMWRRAFRRW